MGLYIHTTSDTSAGALTPIMNRAGVDDGYVSSPCRGCEYEKRDKNGCVGRPGCRIRSYKEPVSAADSSKKRDGVSCSFPGCARQSKTSCGTMDYCLRHHSLVYHRKKRGWPDHKLHDPVIKREFKGEKLHTKLCEFCGNEFHKPPSIGFSVFAGRKYCSQACSQKAHRVNKINSTATPETVLKIRAEYPALSHRQLGEKYGIAKSSIGDILSRKTWKHI